MTSREIAKNGLKESNGKGLNMQGPVLTRLCNGIKVHIPAAYMP